MGYDATAYDDVEPRAPGMYFLRDALNCEGGSGVTVVEADDGWEGMEHDHAEDGQEEVYVLLHGAATLTVDGDTVELAPGDAVRSTLYSRSGLLRGRLEDGHRWRALSRAPVPRSRSRLPRTPPRFKSRPPRAPAYGRRRRLARSGPAEPRHRTRHGRRARAHVSRPDYQRVQGRQRVALPRCPWGSTVAVEPTPGLHTTLAFF